MSVTDFGFRAEVADLYHRYRRGYPSAVLDAIVGATLTQSCGTDETAQHRYRQALSAAGFRAHAVVVEYHDVLSIEQIVGGVLSALPVSRLPDPAERDDFVRQLRDSVQSRAPFEEDVRVRILTGRIEISSARATGCR